MRLFYRPIALAAARCVLPALFLTTGAAWADSYVEFDFARAVECRDVTPAYPSIQLSNVRLIEVLLPVSVRFHELAMSDVEELDIEIDGTAAGLRVYDFAPCTQLASDIAHEIETTTTTKRSRSIDGTLGGNLPVPAGEIVAHVTPSINAGLSGSETATEKINRLPPKLAVVVSGTSSEGRGVFFKIKRSSQTSLEGVHDLAVTFVAPFRWRGSNLQITCTARGQRKLLWMKQDATLGGERSPVQVVLAAAPAARQLVLKPPVDTEPKAGSWRHALQRTVTAKTTNPTGSEAAKETVTQSATD